ncbi:energy transducer TonB [Leeuwenhoekiella parthenopeia]|uniref:Energy transducer TonB n=1 Tax=Leeuwenhoekiella parthenopeia TaxID=2890320 RepID=A0ABS8GUG4_9FLAO|nr:energy transducer TonB [Leeuwenhoekiella parthenopeia]MCC4213431.1 energy transducer TonB [Leeuwenhoekiella parthenopeia]
MSNSQKSESVARQSADRTTSKHDVNLRKNTVVYFQVGLITALILAIVVLELKSPVTHYESPALPDVATVSIDDWNREIRREEVKEVKPEVPEVSKLLPPVVKPNEVEIPDFKFVDPTPPASDETISITSFEPVPEPPVETTTFVAVERVPVFPGCEGLNSNKELKACMQEKMNQFINRNFDTGIGARYGLQGVNKVDIQFTIDEFGKVTDLKTRAPHPALEKEAVRVMEKLPQMEPGKQRDRNVRVIYFQPLKFQVQD